MKLSLGILLCSLWATANALYDHNSDVIELTDTNFNYKVIDSNDIWIVEFYAPWCGHCQALAPEYKKAATALKGIVKVGGVNADEHKSVGGQYGIKGFPTIKVFGIKKSSPDDYQGPRTAEGIIEESFKYLRKLVNSRLGKKASSGEGPKSGDSKDVIELTDANFEETVLQSDEMWLVEFFAPWCGHCKNLAPHWATAATELKGKVKVGAVDATVHTVMASRYNVRGYPTIKMFPTGKKDGAVEFDGGRTSSDIIAWALDKLAENIVAPDIVQLTSNEILKDACDSHQLCIIAILPHILDCQSSCRNGYLKTLRELGEKFKKNQWGWVWSEATVQVLLEDALGLGGFGYPAMAAVNARKVKYAWLKGAFSYDGINEFLRELAVGRGSTVPIKGAALPDIVKTDPWDGKDGKLEVEEDIDVDDVELEPLEKDEL